VRGAGACVGQELMSRGERDSKRGAGGEQEGSRGLCGAGADEQRGAG